MPGNARVNLQVWGGSGSDQTEVAFTDYPLAFTWPGVTAGAKTVIFRTEKSSSGGLGLQAAILYLDEEQSTEWQKGSFDESKILGRITIMDHIAVLGWRFKDEQKQNDPDGGYVTEWPKENTRRPTFVEMTLRFMDGDDPQTLVFWIPTMANPQQFTSGFAGAAAGAGQPGPGQQPGGGPPGTGGPGPGGGKPGGPGGGFGPGGPGGGGGGGGRPPGGGGGRR